MADSPNAGLPPTHSAADPAATTGGDSALVAATPTVSAGRYELGEELARGGMGVVHRATDTALGREVAVKVLVEKFAPDSGAARRFVDEARIAAQLQHPAIPPVHDRGTLADGRPFLAMKLIKGDTLDRLLAARPDPSSDHGRFVAVFERVCEAVAYAHAHHVIHRDLKPSNVMVGAFGEVQVMDWGLAKVLTAGRARDGADPAATAAATEIHGLRESDGLETQAGAVLGTPAYMPPEQAVGAVGRIDQRSDVFGLGAVLTVILTGQPPFADSSAETARIRSAQGDLGECFARLGACGADPGLVALCKRCLSPNPAGRPADGGAVAKSVADLRAAAEERARRAELDRVTAEADRAKAEVRAAEQRKRRRVQLALAGALLVIVSGGVVVAGWAERQAADARLRLARNADAMTALVDRCEGALRNGDKEEAGSALAEVDRRLPEGGGDGLGGRVEQCRADLAFLRELDAIDQFRWTPVEHRLPPGEVVAERWRAGSAAAGLDVNRMLPEDVARRVADSLLQARLVATFDVWLVFGRSVAVRGVLRAADPDPFREAVRDALVGGDRARLEELAWRPEALLQPPGFAEALGQIESIPMARRRAVLESAVRSRPGDLALLMKLGAPSIGLARRERAEERLRWCQAAVAAHPKNAMARYYLGDALHFSSDRDGAIAAYREAIRLDPTFASPRHMLGVVLFENWDLDGAIAAYREGIRLDPKSAGAHINLGTALKARGDLEGAIAEYREAVRLDRKFAGPAGFVIAQAERLRKLLPRLPDVLAGRTAPATPAEACEFAVLCSLQPQSRFAAAVRLYEGAFAAAPELTPGHRYSAACCAARAARGDGVDAPPDPAERASLRGKALAWLRADLAALQKRSASTGAAERKWAVDMLSQWLRSPALSGVRPGPAPTGMPAAERAEWDALWADVKATIAAARPPTPPSPK